MNRIGYIILQVFCVLSFLATLLFAFGIFIVPGWITGACIGASGSTMIGVALFTSKKKRLRSGPMGNVLADDNYPVDEPGPRGMFLRMFVALCALMVIFGCVVSVIELVGIFR